MILLRKFSAQTVSLTSCNVLKVSVYVDSSEALAYTASSMVNVIIISTHLERKNENESDTERNTHT